MKVIKSLTSMRGLAALYVVVAHIYILGGSPPALLWAYFGWSGVGFFFVLSGYLLIKKWLDGDYNGADGKPSLKSFYVKRIFRTWPLYYIVVIAGTIIGVYSFSWISFAYLQEYLPATFVPQAVWTLCAEEAFYFSLPLLMKYVFTSRNRTILATGVAGLISVSYFQFSYLWGFTHVEAVFTVPFWLVAYCFGALLAYNIKLKFNLWILMVVFLMFVLYYQQEEYTIFTALLVSGLYFLVISTVENMKILENKVLVFFGNISYSVYLLHTYMMYAVGQYFFGQHILCGTLYCDFVVPPWALILTALGCIGLSTLTYYFIEKPFNKLGRKLLIKLKRP